MWRAVAICAVFCLHSACGLDVSNEEYNPKKVFIHPKDVTNKTSGISPRIVGGTEVTPHSYPSQAALIIYTSDNTYFCGGSLISNRWVLTAAHCLDASPYLITVVLGGHHVYPFDSSATMVDTTQYVYHSGWNEDTFRNDVGLVKLPYNITFTDYIKPTSLAGGSSNFAGMNGTVVGWGYTDNYPELSSALRSVESVIMTNDACANMNDAYKQIIQPTHICLSGNGTVGSCSGDSGGPLFVNGIQVGIVSFGYVDCTAGWPSVFTRVTEFEDWIIEHAVDGTAGLDTMKLAGLVLVAMTLLQFFK